MILILSPSRPIVCEVRFVIKQVTDLLSVVHPHVSRSGTRWCPHQSDTWWVCGLVSVVTTIPSEEVTFQLEPHCPLVPVTMPGEIKLLLSCSFDFKVSDKIIYGSFVTIEITSVGDPAPLRTVNHSTWSRSITESSFSNYIKFLHYFFSEVFLWVLQNLLGVDLLTISHVITSSDILPKTTCSPSSRRP